MKRKHVLLAPAGALTLWLGIATSGFGDTDATHQCYYRPGIDPESACTACADDCGGPGFLCCRIVIDNPSTMTD